MEPLSPLAHPPKLTHPSALLLIGYDAMNASRVDDRLPRSIKLMGTNADCW